MTLEVAISPELIGEWKRYIDEIAARNSEKQKNYSEAATSLYEDHAKRVQELKDEEERCRIAYEEAERLLSSHIKRETESQRSFSFPWWNLDEPIPTIPEVLIENSRAARREYHESIQRRMRDEWRFPDTVRYLGRRPANEEPTMVGFLTWMANQGLGQS